MIFKAVGDDWFGPGLLGGWRNLQAFGSPERTPAYELYIAISNFPCGGQPARAASGSKHMGIVLTTRVRDVGQNRVHLYPTPTTTNPHPSFPPLSGHPLPSRQPAGFKMVLLDEVALPRNPVQSRRELQPVQPDLSVLTPFSTSSYAGARMNRVMGKCHSRSQDGVECAPPGNWVMIHGWLPGSGKYQFVQIGELDGLASVGQVLRPLTLLYELWSRAKAIRGGHPRGMLGRCSKPRQAWRATQTLDCANERSAPKHVFARVSGLSAYSAI
ncbi:predicted protein [Plenodomus lingam JN3]|uniref:Predicted protein n=1 Tax=Leptosphaeria maculans (strain JN3 / isolate v23.1.3 / race Av1-4-5-6-7-8) TaxID=985895 RepID=E5A0W0_LEPMJ|nr:predicted protein [Plenodomus lingam JN3]CBX97256.1 predicted protein [Plenodomus lingam JN3]